MYNNTGRYNNISMKMHLSIIPHTLTVHSQEFLSPPELSLLTKEFRMIASLMAYTYLSNNTTS